MTSTMIAVGSIYLTMSKAKLMIFIGFGLIIPDTEKSKLIYVTINLSRSISYKLNVMMMTYVLKSINLGSSRKNRKLIYSLKASLDIFIGKS